MLRGNAQARQFAASSLEPAQDQAQTTAGAPLARGPDDAVPLVIGVDEAGRGPIAGPVVAAAVHIPDSAEAALAALDDSKRLSEVERDRAWDAIHHHAILAYHAVDVPDIDRLNILHATMVAMACAVSQLRTKIAARRQGRPSIVLVDGNRIPPATPGAVYCVKGDQTFLSVAAASIVAKVARDRLMTRLADRFPVYGFARHKGYGTPAHLEALAEYGPTPHHRRSFAPVQRALARG